MKRVFALVVAVGFIAVAVFARGLIDDRDTGTGGGGGGTPATGLTIVCISELASVCEGLHDANDKLVVRVEEAQTTLDSLVSGEFQSSDVGFDAWLTVSPYPALVADQRDRALLEPALEESSEVLARSPMTLVGWNDRLAPLTDTCGTVTWTCLGDHAAQPWPTVGGHEGWGAVKPGQAHPARSATGLLTISQAATNWFGNSDFASNDFEDPAFEAWFTRLERGVPTYPTPPRTPLDDMLQKGPSTFDVSGSPEAIAAPAVQRSRYNGALTLLYPEPMVTADVVLVPVSGSRHVDDVAKLAASDALRAALLDAGWRVPDSPLPPAARPDVVLPDADGLPRTGVVEALRDKWLEVTR